MTEGISDNTDYRPYLSIIGFRVDPDNVNADIYTVLRIDPEGKDRVLRANGYLLFTPSIDRIPDLIKACDSEGAKERIASDSPECMCDVARTLYLIENEDSDYDGTIILCVNVLLDVIDSLDVEIPEQFKVSLHSIADHMTFNREFGDFLIKSNLPRVDILNAIRWCVGLAVTKANFIR
jgi:hypothetical protein